MEQGFVINDGVLTPYIGEGGNVVIPSEVTSIGDEAFAYSSVISVKIPGTMKSIVWRAFWNCYNLEKVFISKELTNLPSKSSFPLLVKKMGEYAFGKEITLIMPEDSQVLEFVEKNKFSFSIE